MKPKIICGDNVEILKTFEDNYIDLTVTSPPYDNLRDYKGYKFRFEVLAQELFRVTKEGGIVVWIVGDQVIDGSETLTSFQQAIYFKEEVGFNMHDTMIYQKDCFANPMNTRYHQIFEYMFVLSKGKPKTFNPLIDKPNKSYGKYTFGKGRRQKDGTMKFQGTERLESTEFGKRFNIWKYNTGFGNVTKDKNAYEHPAIFPEKLARDHILSWSNKGDLILDPMNGSGTTTKMAYYNNRESIGIDCSEEYCKIARDRIKFNKISEYFKTNQVKIK